MSAKFPRGGGGYDHLADSLLSRQLTLGNQTDLMLLDFSKAFDKVNHLKLLLKVTNYGIKGNTLNWIKYFLISWSRTIVLDGESSNEVPVTSEVPQGSVLCQLLFLLYINDLPDNIQSQVRLFADDTAIYLTVSSANDSSITQSDLDTLRCWERTWDMEFNPSKCQVLHISRSRSPIKSKYYIHGQELEPVDSAKYLEVNIGADLSWNSHIIHPDLRGGSLKWALKFFLKHTTFYQNFEVSLIWTKNFPRYSIHFW